MCKTCPPGHEVEKHSHKQATGGLKTQIMRWHIHLWHKFSYQTDQQGHQKPIIGTLCYHGLIKTNQGLITTENRKIVNLILSCIRMWCYYE